MQLVTDKLMWSDRLFKENIRSRNIIGYDISTLYKALGRVRLLSGMCLSKKGKNSGILQSAIQLRRKVPGGYIYIYFNIFFGSAFRYKVVGFSYKKKKIVFSKISLARLA